MQKSQQQPLSFDPQAIRNVLSRLVPERRVFTWRRVLPVLLLGLTFGVYLALVQFASPDLPDNDGYYHVKMAYLMRTEGLKPDFPYLPLSILNPREYYDHHFLYHVALMPFTFGDLRLGAKWSAVLFASLAFLLTWNVLKNQRIPYAWLWALGLLAVSEAFIYRMSIPRAQSLSLALLMLGLDWLWRQKYKRLAVLAGLYVWLYNAFPLLLVMGIVFVAATWLADRRLDLRPVTYIGAGTIAGLIINPYFPYNVLFAGMHILPKLFEATAIGVGSEWYPYDTAQLLENSPLALAAFVSGAVGIGLSGKRIDRRTLTSLLLAALFGLMLFQSRRFVEYFPAFSLLFAACAWSPVIKQYLNMQKGQGLQSGADPASTPQRDVRHVLGRLNAGLRRQLPALVLLAILLPGIGISFVNASSSLKASKPYETYAGASAWLAANSPAGERVFQTDWDDFPRLFFYNTHNTYLIGLDPTYMWLYDRQLYSIWVDVTQGRIQQPAATIHRLFGAGYVISDLRHTSFLERAAEDRDLVPVYRDENSVVFQVLAAENDG